MMRSTKYLHEPTMKRRKNQHLKRKKLRKQRK
jgi:hypothetical protein